MAIYHMKPAAQAVIRKHLAKLKAKAKAKAYVEAKSK